MPLDQTKRDALVADLVAHTAVVFGHALHAPQAENLVAILERFGHFDAPEPQPEIDRADIAQIRNAARALRDTLFNHIQVSGEDIEPEIRAIVATCCQDAGIDVAAWPKIDAVRIHMPTVRTLASALQKAFPHIAVALVEQATVADGIDDGTLIDLVKALTPAEASADAHEDKRPPVNPEDQGDGA
jgi:hypothetical protein